MSAETVIGLADQLAVEPSFAAARFVSCNQKDGVALRIEGKSDSPLTIGRAEPQFFHIRVIGAVQRIHAGAA